MTSVSTTRSSTTARSPGPCGRYSRTESTPRTVSFTGALSDTWTIQDFSPLGYIPNGVRLTAYGGAASDLPADVFDHQLRAIAEGWLKVSVAKVYQGLESVREAQSDLEAGVTPGKYVVVPG